MDHTRQTIRAFSTALHQKEISSVELTQYFIERIERLNPTLNAFITCTPELALQQAKQADQRLARGEGTPLTGIPIAHKDNLCTAFVRTTCASKMLHHFIPHYNATVVERLEAAGSVMLGKTNMDEFAMGSSSENSFYGPVRNPWNTKKSAGGSSGGSASAVAAYLALGATGTDTGGSIRQPASYCNLTGLKPSYGLVSRFGMVAHASSLDQAGPMAQTAEDLALMLHVMVGFDPKDSTSLEVPIPHYPQQLNDRLPKPMTIGIPENFFHEELHPEVLACMTNVQLALKEMGIVFKSIELPYMQYAIPAYYVLAPVECASNLARFDGVRYGHRCAHPKDMRDLYVRSRGEGFGPEVKRRIMVGTYALSSGHYSAYYLQAQKIRRLIQEDFLKAYKDVQLIMMPTTPSTAVDLGTLIQDPILQYLSDIYTISVNLAGLPALSMPAGFSQNMPIGIQLIGPYCSESLLLQVAHHYQKTTSWHQCVALPE